MNLIEKIMNFFGARNTGRRKWPVNKQKPKSKPKPKPAVKKGKQIHYLLNDHTTPGLTKHVDPPTPPKKPPFVVKGYKGGGYTVRSEQGQAANVHVTTSNTLNYMMGHCEKKLDRWASGKPLYVVPRAGKQLNAFYNRLSMQFFYAPVPGGTVFTADSSDIVAHELGHAILDSYRPATWGAASLEVWSFHEAFADLTAMLNIMQHDEVLVHALKQTKNNIRTRNVFSNLAEDVGKAIYNLSRGKGGRHPNYLRSAINDFKYVNPGTLPRNAPHNRLAAECHSFGRIFLGAFYDILVMIYEDLKKNGKKPIDALKGARDYIAKIVMKAIINAPLNVKFYESVAKTMLWADWTSGKKYHDRMKKIFLNRNLIKQELRMLNAPECDNEDNIVVGGAEVQTIKLSEHIIRIQSENQLYDVDIDIPQNDAFFYDEDKNVIDAMSVTFEETLSGAQDMIMYLHSTESVSDGPDTPFEITEGKLQRTHFV